MRSLLLPAAIAATIATVSATSADAQRRGVRPPRPNQEQLGQLNARLDSAKRSIAGYSSTGLGSIGRLMDDSSETWGNYELHVTGRYAFVGVCIDGCTNLDLRVLKEDGSLLVEETRAGSAASLQFTAPANGVYKLVVRMEACPQGSCYYEIKMLYAG